MLFPGFQLDLDTGQVVPEGLGGDLVFTARGDEDGIISSLGPARISTLDRPPSLPPTAPGIPSEGRVVRPADFSGRFRLAANGQWSGLLELAVDPAGSVTGSFQSDASGSAYPVTGKVDPQLHQKVQFAIQFPRARQDYQGVLWTEGKQVMAGTLAMLGQDFSFVAVREGSRLDLGDLSAAAPGKPGGTWLRVRVEAEPTGTCWGSPKTRAAEWPGPSSPSGQSVDRDAESTRPSVPRLRSAGSSIRTVIALCPTAALRGTDRASASLS